VAIVSAKGYGSTVRFVLPISMVLTKVMVVACGDERYGLALDGVVETTRVTPIGSAGAGGRAFMLRDQVVPLVAWATLSAAPKVKESGALRVIVARVGGSLSASRSTLSSIGWTRRFGRWPVCWPARRGCGLDPAGGRRGADGSGSGGADPDDGLRDGDVII
jgi:hypothetical protein